MKGATGPRRFIGVVGAGVGGLTAAYLLAKLGHHVTLYEAENRPGGHAYTPSAPQPLPPAWPHPAA